MTMFLNFKKRVEKEAAFINMQRNKKRKLSTSTKKKTKKISRFS